MERVKLVVTPEEYRMLMELVFAGNWLINSHREKPLERYDAVEQAVYSGASQAGYPDLVEFDEAEEAFYPSRAFEDSQQQNIGEYDDYTFWEELIERLAERDFLAKYGKSVDTMLPEARSAELDRLRDFYGKELEDHGIERLLVTTKPERDARS